MKFRFTRDRAITCLFAAFSLALAFWQRPGWATADTKIDLHVDPVRFLSQVASAWTPTTDLGEVHSAQYSGYLWPMGPFFALLHCARDRRPGSSQRMWLALMFLLAVWGMLKLLDVLVGRPRGTVARRRDRVLPAESVRDRVHRADDDHAARLRGAAVAAADHPPGPARARRRGWRGVAGLAIVVVGERLRARSSPRRAAASTPQSSPGCWSGRSCCSLYEPAIGTVRWRDSLGVPGARSAALGLLASLWWIVPLLVHVSYGIDFLQFTEQPSTIWATNSLTESLRLMGYWTSYIGVGFGLTRPFFSDGGTMLFNPFVVGASLLLPALAMAGYVRARRDQLRAAAARCWSSSAS